jgi:uncharacterized protein
MSDNSQTTRARASWFASPWLFFLLVFLLSIPFYVLGAAGGRLPIATFLPVSALMAFIPMIAALVIVFRQSSGDGAKEFLGRAFDYRRIKGVGWILATLLLMPLVLILEYGVHSFSGTALPDAQLFSIAEGLAFFLMFFVGAIGEELGWQGYAFAGLRERWSALGAALILGAIWALWHVIPYAEMGRGADWIIWQCLSTIALRVILVWLFVNAGQSVFIAVLFHTMINIAWGLFPSYGSYYDPFVMFVILALVAGATVAVWGAATLANFEHARRNP